MQYRLEVIEYPESHEDGDSTVFEAAAPKLVWQKEYVSEKRAIRDAQHDIVRRLRQGYDAEPRFRLYSVIGCLRTEIDLPRIVGYEKASWWESICYGRSYVPRFEW